MYRGDVLAVLDRDTRLSKEPRGLRQTGGTLGVSRL